jgi:LCP family protein required for cell wall assembly
MSYPPTPQPASRKRRRGKKKFIVLIVLAAIIIGCCSWCASVDASLHSFKPEYQQALDSKLSGTSAMGIQPVNVLLLGSDERVDDPELGARTDAIILCRVNPATGKVMMVSIPRDTMIELDGYGTQKINAAYAFSGPVGTIDAVETLCGVKVDRCVAVDFSGLCGIVDAIGGIDIHVEEEINDPDAGDEVIPAGDLHVNGAQALIISRSRAYTDGDYTRQANQRKVISAIVDRISNMAPWEVPGALSGVSACVSADGGTGVGGLALMALRLKMAGMDIQSEVLPSHPEDIDGISYVVAETDGISELMQRFSAV